MPKKKAPRIVIFSSLLLGLTAFTAASASIKRCTPDETEHAVTESSVLSSWAAVYSSYRNYAHCDYAGIWERYSESVVRLLVSNFDECGKLCALTNKDKAFEQFVVRHIDKTVPPEALEKILLNVQFNCPSNASQLCYLIKTAAEH